ncbi:hypothetical protein, partial [Eisenbergiella tayi]|uniref:hypothetical protein n=1 Tax=Eisenbergiella tayi TaxID=1432052 RepID=UPI00307C6519
TRDLAKVETAGSSPVYRSYRIGKTAVSGIPASRCFYTIKAPFTKRIFCQPRLIFMLSIHFPYKYGL